MGEHKRKPRPAAMGPKITVKASEIRTDHLPPLEERPVSLKDREGVFVHSFTCNDCWLHFNVYSWQADRHTCASIICPECGQHEGRFVHWRAVISESVGFGMNGAREIYGHVPYPGAQMMDDSRTPGT